MNPSSTLLNDIRHILAACVYFAVMAVDRMQTWSTYRYGRHLDRVSFVRRRHRHRLAADHRERSRWCERLPFLDRTVDDRAFSALPEETLGRIYHDVMSLYRDKGYPDLRTYRLQNEPSESWVLEPDPARAGEEASLQWLIDRRNVYMTASHDFCHVMTGGNDRCEGEVIVALYQLHALGSPQNAVTAFGGILSLVVLFRLSSLTNVVRAFRSIRRAPSYRELDLESLWHLPIGEARARAGLPPAGLMPGQPLVTRDFQLRPWLFAGRKDTK